MYAEYHIDVSDLKDAHAVRVVQKQRGGSSLSPPGGRYRAVQGWPLALSIVTLMLSFDMRPHMRYGRIKQTNTGHLSVLAGGTAAGQARLMDASIDRGDMAVDEVESGDYAVHVLRSSYCCKPARRTSRRALACCDGFY
jgi:hypothetical protein